jgi:hypothetical protein
MFSEVFAAQAGQIPLALSGNGCPHIGQGSLAISPLPANVIKFAFQATFLRQYANGLATRN